MVKFITHGEVQEFYFALKRSRVRSRQGEKFFAQFKKVVKGTPHKIGHRISRSKNSPKNHFKNYIFSKNSVHIPN
jgi:hypothetical protein